MFEQARDRAMKVAEECGETIWKEGLLKKGNGLCHGIAGNGYMLHSIFRHYDRLYMYEDDLKQQKVWMHVADLWRTRSY